MSSLLASSKGLCEAGGAGLRVERVAGASAVTSAWARNPMKLLTPRARGASVWAFTSSFGGGLVAGDQTTLSVELGVGAGCFVGTQASTKVYRNPTGLPSGHRTEAMLGPGSLLVFAPDPVQAFAQSSYEQRQEFRLARDAGLVLVDWFTAGRTARGERWQLDSYHSRNDVFVDGRRVFVDSLLLEPGQGALDGPHRLGRFNCVANLLLVGPVAASVGERLQEMADETPVARAGRTISMTSRFNDGLIVRIAGESTEEVGRMLHSRLHPLVSHLSDDPWARKW